MNETLTILGGGVCGLAAAAELSARGARVTVLDPAGAPPSGALPGGDSERPGPPCACCTHAFHRTLCCVTRGCLCWGPRHPDRERRTGPRQPAFADGFNNTGLRAAPSLYQLPAAHPPHRREDLHQQSFSPRLSVGACARVTPKAQPPAFIRQENIFLLIAAIWRVMRQHCGSSIFTDIAVYAADKNAQAFHGFSRYRRLCSPARTRRGAAAAFAPSVPCAPGYTAFPEPA